MIFLVVPWSVFAVYRLDPAGEGLMGVRGGEQMEMVAEQAKMVQLDLMERGLLYDQRFEVLKITVGFGRGGPG